MGTMPTKNIIVVSTPSLAANRARRGGTDKNYSLWGGGSTTVVSPDGGSNGDVILAELECVPSVVKYKVNTENTARPRANKRKAEEEQKQTGCGSLQAEETGPDRDPPGGGQQLGEEEQEPGGGGGRPEGRQGGAAVHPGCSQELLLAPGEGGAGD